VSANYLIFIHRFSRSVQCEVRVPDHPPEPGSRNTLSFEWTGHLKRKHVPAYRQWILSTNQILADRWQITMLYALGTHLNRTELWQFKPGTAPTLLERLNVGIP
jgi:hypothetical protein